MITDKTMETTTGIIPAMCRMTNTEINKMIGRGICPDCGKTLSNGGNCFYCNACGFSKC